MPFRIKIRDRTLRKIERQRICWLKIGAIFAPFVGLVILEWNAIISLGNNLWLLAALIIALIGVSWWFWTMAIIRVLINYKLIELEILRGTVDDIKAVYNDVKKIK